MQEDDDCRRCLLIPSRAGRILRHVGGGPNGHHCGRRQETMEQESADVKARKRAIRRRAEANRRAQPDKDEASRVICERFAALPEYGEAETVMCYVHMRAEVRTQPFLPAAIEHGKRIVVPYCLKDELGLFLLESMDELAVGTYRILEPKTGLRWLPAKQIDAARLDLIMVPGVAFDRQGARLGHGRGYYDKLLSRVRPEAALVGVAFECQIFPEIPTLPHDVSMDTVITERGIYRGKGRRTRA